MFARLSEVLERTGPLPVDEAVALGLLVLELWKPAPSTARLEAAPAAVLLLREGGVRILSPSGPRAWVAAASDFQRQLYGSPVCWASMGPRAHASWVHGVAALVFCALVVRPPARHPRGGTVSVGASCALLRELRSDLPEQLVEHLGTSLGVRALDSHPDELRARLFSWLAEDGFAGSRDALLARAFEAVQAPAPSERRSLSPTADAQERLVLADQLEERGRLEEAEWLRLELQLRADADPAVLAKLRALRPALTTTFLASVSRPITEGCPVRFGLKCSRQWADLQLTVDPLRRFCGQCGQDVLYVDSIDAARDAASRGQCIAVDLAVHRHAGDLRESAVLGLPVMPA